MTDKNHSASLALRADELTQRIGSSDLPDALRLIARDPRTYPSTDVTEALTAAADVIEEVTSELAVTARCAAEREGAGLRAQLHRLLDAVIAASNDLTVTWQANREALALPKWAADALVECDYRYNSFQDAMQHLDGLVDEAGNPVPQPDELAELGRITMEMFSADPRHWRGAFPERMVVLIKRINEGQGVTG